jgi:hypothetical protein
LEMHTTHIVEQKWLHSRVCLQGQARAVGVLEQK